MNKQVIYIRQLIDNLLNTMDEAQKLFKILSETYYDASVIILNFEGVDFMSRSFADEFFKLKLNWSTKHANVTIDIENAEIQIIEILNAVSRTQYTRDVKITESFSPTFTIGQQLSDYLQSW